MKKSTYHDNKLGMQALLGIVALVLAAIVISVVVEITLGEYFFGSEVVCYDEIANALRKDLAMENNIYDSGAFGRAWVTKHEKELDAIAKAYGLLDSGTLKSLFFNGSGKIRPAALVTLLEDVDKKKHLSSYIEFKKPTNKLLTIVVFVLTLLASLCAVAYVMFHKSAVVSIVPDEFKTVFADLVRTHAGIAKGIYANYPESQIKGILNIYSNSKDKNDNVPGGILAFFDFPIYKYSKLAEELLNRARKSVESTTYHPTFGRILTYFSGDSGLGSFDFDENELNELKQTADEVRMWIDGVNEKAVCGKKNGINVSRVLLIDNTDKSLEEEYNTKYSENSLETFKSQYLCFGLGSICCLRITSKVS